MPNIKPILFNTDMVRALLDNRKTVTRRVVKLQSPSETHPNLFVTPPYRPGGILYVRKMFAKISDWTTVGPDVGMFDGYIYKADWMDGAEHPKWRPSIHMPREAARVSCG